ncbi:hypothetical protein RhiirC2_792722 [Rhizophagus irregularis]|uniref:Uncharacterized protein n=1 Tax=Rhizophagus irregularis TaxID=588596 RepID=A0A2N1MGU6_9GLOM|nr:hypothetical protein RhiirC2_792722 [Rhizophagus irregularis]
MSSLLKILIFPLQVDDDVHSIAVYFGDSNKNWRSKNFKTTALSEYASMKDHTDATNLKIAELIKVSNNFINKAQNHLISASNTITYENNVSGREMLSAISNSIEETIWKELDEAIAFGIMVGEITDISCEPHLVIYIKYCLHGKINIIFKITSTKK